MEKDDGMIDLRNINPDIEIEQNPIRLSPLGRNAKVKTLYFIVSLAGAIGALTRYFITGLVTNPSDGFPLATFLINVTGTFFLAFVLILILERFPNSALARPLLATGFCGAYTTFSTFMVEESLLIKDHNFAVGIVYLLAATTAGLLVTFVGINLARFFYKLDSYLGIQESIEPDPERDMAR